MLGSLLFDNFSDFKEVFINPNCEIVKMGLREKKYSMDNKTINNASNMKINSG